MRSVSGKGDVSKRGVLYEKPPHVSNVVKSIGRGCKCLHGDEVGQPSIRTQAPLVCPTLASTRHIRVGCMLLISYQRCTPPPPPPPP